MDLQFWKDIAKEWIVSRSAEDISRTRETARNAFEDDLHKRQRERSIREELMNIEEDDDDDDY